MHVCVGCDVRVHTRRTSQWIAHCGVPVLTHVRAALFFRSCENVTAERNGCCVGMQVREAVLGADARMRPCQPKRDCVKSG